MLNDFAIKATHIAFLRPMSFHVVFEDRLTRKPLRAKIAIETESVFSHVSYQIQLQGEPLGTEITKKVVTADFCFGFLILISFRFQETISIFFDFGPSCDCFRIETTKLDDRFQGTKSSFVTLVLKF